MAKSKHVKHVAKTQKKETSVESYIETRFDRLEDKLDSFKDEINAWKQEFVKQLTKLYTNMESVLNTIAEHEARITKLEQGKIQSDTQKQTISQLASFGWWAAKLLLGAGALVGGILGTAGAWKIIFGT